MEWVKTTAKTLPEAIDLALDNLGVDESDAEIVVLEEPRTGLFGRTKGTARVEARVKPKQSRPKQERRKNNSKNKARGERPGRNSGGRNRSQNKSKDSGDRGRNRSQGQQGKKRQSQNDGAGVQAEKLTDDNTNGTSGEQNARNGGGRSQGGRDQGNREQARGDQGGGRSRGGRGRGGNNGGSGDRNKRNSEGHAKSENKADSGPKVETPVEDVKNHLQDFLSGLTEAFGFEGPVTVDESPEDGLTGQVAGQHGLMVGPKGRTLDAIQELARISSSRKVPSSVRIKVDVGGYRFQRSAALADFAAKAADKAVENSVEVALDPMSAADRKAVHDALTDDARVETRSVGTDPRRKVLVVPVVEADNGNDDDDDELVEAASGESSGTDE